MRTVLDTLGAIYELARLAVITRFRFRGEYWTWRLNTAFGRGYPTTRGELLRSVMAYGRWMHAIRRGL
jgi:hypothetical protein